MTTIQIKHRYTSRVLFECAAPELMGSGMHVRHATEQAAKSGADLSGANLSCAYLYGADLSGAKLSGANLSGANLSGAYFSGADLSGAYLSSAEMSGANLYGANLSGVDLSGVDLSGAYLYGVNLSGAIVRGLKLACKRPAMWIGPIGSKQRTVYAYITEDGMRIRAGCFFGTRNEFVHRVASTHGDNEHAKEYAAALVLIDAHAELWSAKEVEKVAA